FDAQMKCTQQLVITFDCDLTLYRYPFDRQDCEARFFVDSETQGMVTKNINITIKKRSQDLLEYDLMDIEDSVENDTYGNIIAVLQFKLKGKFVFHLVNAFIPTLLLYFVSYATFFFRLENFNERIMTSLTALLVMATLIATSSAVTVQTQYLKLIDVWYLIMIILCFLVVICQAIIDHLYYRCQNTPMKPMTSRIDEKVNNIFKGIF
ncbi:unnamed protein product, partial [Meganyctiphanes norvegica]